MEYEISKFALALVVSIILGTPIGIGFYLFARWREKRLWNKFVDDTFGIDN